MKRCPQCEFIYEDDQSLCDMDGVLLVFDSRTLPNLHGVHALATVSGPVPEKGPRRSRMVPAFATLILMLAAASVYYVTTMSNSTPPDFTPATVNATGPEMPAITSSAPPAPTPAAEEPPKEEPRETHSSPARVEKPAAEPARKAATTNSAPAKPDPKKKDDSKVESIIKKTGRLLKKPFKF